MKKTTKQLYDSESCSRFT